MASHKPFQHKAAPQHQSKNLSAAITRAAQTPTAPLMAPPHALARPVAAKPARRRQTPPRREGPQSPSGAEHFLRLLCESADIAASIKKCGLPPAELFALLLDDAAFREKFDARTSLKLELAAIDSALRGNATITTFLLSNRLPQRYRKGTVPAARPAQPQQIVFLAPENREENCEH